MRALRLEQLPKLEGRHVAVIGQGSIGLLFSYAAKASGRRATSPASTRSTATPSPRSSAWTPWFAPPATAGSSHLQPNDKPDVVIEAVGHQVATLGHAIEAAAFGGTVFYFGVPDDDSYPISMRSMLRKNLTLKSGVTLDRRRVLRRADEFARDHPELLTNYLTHTFAVDDVQAAFELACRPVPERVKIAVVE